MSATHTRSAISDSIGYTEIIDSKFKTDTISVRFLLPLQSDLAAACTLAATLITTTTQKQPSLAAMSKKSADLYGAYLSENISTISNFQQITFTASTISNPYALQQENLLQETLHWLLDALFQPNVVNDAFTDFEFQMKKKDHLEAIDARINDKRGYAIFRARRIAYQNEPSALSCFGTKEEAKALTPAAVYAAYQHMLKTAAVEIYHVGAEPQPAIFDAMQQAFSKLERSCTIPETYRCPSPCKETPETVVESLPVNQCKLVMVLKSDYPDRFPVLLMNGILGGSPTSKLFINVREKQSLCYYCASGYNSYKRTLTIDSGVERENLEKTKTEILRQLDEIRNGNITPEELQNAKMGFFDSIRSVGDSPNSYIHWEFANHLNKEPLTKEACMQKYIDCTVEQIAEAARSFRLDTIYIMDTMEHSHASEQEEATV